MKDVISKVLKSIIDLCGIDTFTNPQFKSILSDVRIESDEKKIRNLLNIAIVEMKSYSRLKNALDNGNTSAVTILTEEMYNDYGVDKATAKVVIECIADLLHVPKSVDVNTSAKDFGDAIGLFEQGEKYKNGNGVEKDLFKAVYLYRKSAEQGYAPAQRMLGNCFMDGEGVIKDPGQAFYWIKKSFDQGFVPAINTMGYCYDLGIGVEEDKVQAFNYYKQAAEQGHSGAQCNLGICYERGNGTEADCVQAVHWYKKAAEQGFSNAQCNLGNCYKYGSGVEEDYIQAAYWYRKAAEQGDSQAQCYLGDFYRFGDGVEMDVDQARYWYMKAAEKGDVFAMSSLYQIYRLEYNDAVNALYWLKQSAENGYAEYQYELASMFYKGSEIYKSDSVINYEVPNLIEADKKQGIFWYKKAAEQGHNRAQFRLGELYEEGDGVEKDPVKAVQYYKNAADNGIGDAMTALVRCYKDGIGVEKNDGLAEYWQNQYNKTGIFDW